MILDSFIDWIQHYGVFVWFGIFVVSILFTMYVNSERIPVVPNYLLYPKKNTESSEYIKAQKLLDEVHQQNIQELQSWMNRLESAYPAKQIAIDTRHYVLKQEISPVISMRPGEAYYTIRGDLSNIGGVAVEFHDSTDRIVRVQYIQKSYGNVVWNPERAVWERKI